MVARHVALALNALLVSLGALACGRRGFDPTDASPGAGTGDAVADAIVVTPLGRAASIGIGGRSALCAVLDDGSLWCWGDQRWGAIPDASTEPFALPVRIGTATDWRSITLGGGHGCGIREPGTLWCWGANQYGEVGNGSQLPVTSPVQIGTATNWADVTAGYYSTCARTTAGSVSCWGRNQYGQLGDNSMTLRTSPQLVPGLPAAVQVAAGDQHVCAIDASNALRCWGFNVTGCIGNGTTNTALTPVVVPGTWTRIDARIENTAAIASDGTLWSWGNGAGSSPAQVGTSTGWQDVQATLYGLCALRAGGDLWCEGGGSFGVTGPKLDNNPLLTQISPGSSFDTVRLTAGTACANRDGQLECIGTGNEGQLGDFVERFARSPQQISGAWSNVSLASFSTCGVSATQVSYCWGATSAVPGEMRPQVPTQFALPAASVVAQSGSSGIAITTTGELWHWGAHSLDTGGTEYVTPAALFDGSAWSTTISIYDSSLAAIRSDGTLWTWGSNASGELGDGTIVTRGSPTFIGPGYVDVSMGNSHTCGIRTDNSVWCWGYNGYGEIGDGTTTNRLSPVASVAGAWSQVTAGAFGTLAIRGDGTLWAWGSNGQGRLGLGGSDGTMPPTQVGTATWLAVDSHLSTSCAVRSDRTLWCWGDNADGQATGAIGPAVRTPQQLGTAADWATVAVGDAHACAHKLDGALWCWGRNYFGELGTGLSWRATYGPVARP